MSDRIYLWVKGNDGDTFRDVRSKLEELEGSHIRENVELTLDENKFYFMGVCFPEEHRAIVVGLLNSHVLPRGNRPDIEHSVYQGKFPSAEDIRK
ncbi:hypothetical protein CMI48_00275 [Candidatus Pacearchaeota archaeon]|nr:hypothetical protein [Candidatus Pacearchaeota archaeon]|tara:strand:- start:247 stop:531 length:285 start_codon:yes stop_codon:yes gene_type:complete